LRYTKVHKLQIDIITQNTQLQMSTSTNGPIAKRTITITNRNNYTNRPNYKKNIITK